MDQLRWGKSWSHNSERLFAVIIYMCLKLSGISRKQIDCMMQLLGTYRCETAHYYAIKFINEDEENRGGYRREDIFDIYPTLKDYIKGYTIQKVSERNSKFTIQTLRNFAVNKPKEYTDNIDINFNNSVISERMLNTLLFSWGFYWGKNKARPFFNGHERSDVIVLRENFVRQ